MSFIFSSGAVAPFGLLSHNTEESAIAAFNQSYKNTGIKAGLVKTSYSPSDPQNQNHLCTEYDVLTIEQMENKGTTSILYKHCISTQGFGSIADYFEYTLRPLTKQNSKGFPDFSNQDGAIVLIQCLNNIGDKAVVIGTLIHPDRPTNVTNNSPQLYGEYNGVNIQINEDGSCSLTFKGGTDSQGVPTDTSQGNTEVKIEKDGSFEVNHSMVTFRMDKTTGAATINAKDDINLITSTNLNVKATANVVVNCVEADVTASGKIVMKASEIDLNNPVSGITTSNSHQGVIDFITGIPVQPSKTVLSDV